MEPLQLASGASLPDNSMAGILHGSCCIGWVSCTAREGWLLIKVAILHTQGRIHHSGLRGLVKTLERLGGTETEGPGLGIGNGHCDNPPPWS